MTPLNVITKTTMEHGYFVIFVSLLLSLHQISLAIFAVAAFALPSSSFRRFLGAAANPISV